MPNNFVNIDRNTKFGPHTVELSNLLRRCRELAQSELDRMGHMNDGNDFSPICGPFGVPPGSDASAAGQDHFDGINGVKIALAVSEITNFINRFG